MDIGDFFKKAQNIQEKMNDIYKKRVEMEFLGQSGGGLVKVRVNGEKSINAVDIDKSLINPEEKEILEDLIVAALNDAFAKADKSAKDDMSSTFSDFGLPPGMKMPF